MAHAQTGVNPDLLADWVRNRLAVLTYIKEATPAELKRPVAMYGQPPQPAGRLAALAFEHSVWTLGQVVPYLRLNGVTPPEYKMPF